MISPNEPINAPIAYRDDEKRAEAHRRWAATGELPTIWARPGQGPAVEIASMLTPNALNDAVTFFDREPARAIQTLWLPWVHAFHAHVQARASKIGEGHASRFLAVLRQVMARGGSAPDQSPGLIAQRVTAKLEQARKLRVDARKFTEDADRMEREAMCDAQALSALLARTAVRHGV